MTTTVDETMKIIDSIEGVRSWRADTAGDVGLVPTMGYLHEGHLSLVRRAAADNARVAVSIFVNPAQFNRTADLKSYPRDLARDVALLTEAGCDMVFTPDAKTLYPPGFDTWVAPGRVAEPNEGAHRPGHFRGVATVVLKLLNIIQPQRAYFGQKDAQQLAVVRALARDLDVAVDVIGVATVREADGLAMSSRNVRLDPAERAAAPVLHRALQAAATAWHDGERDAEILRSRMRAVLATEPRAILDYVSVADPDTLEEVTTAIGGRARVLLSVAATLGRARLIDNVVVETELHLAPP